MADEGNPLAAEEEPGPDSLRARGCVKRLRWGRKAAALRVLLSPGVANEHPRAEAIMRDMHPAPSRPIVAPRDLGPGLAALPADVQDALLCLFRCDFTSMDFSGWNMDLLRPVRGRPDIMGPLSDLVRALANCELPLPQNRSDDRYSGPGPTVRSNTRYFESIEPYYPFPFSSVVGAK